MAIKDRVANSMFPKPSLPDNELLRVNSRIVSVWKISLLKTSLYHLAPDVQ